MKKIARRLFWIFATAGIVIALLAIANRLPSLVQDDFARRYDTLEEAGKSLGFISIMTPSYFPEGISWPPSLILGQKKPFRAVVMEFNGRDAKDTELVVIQSFSQKAGTGLERLKLSELKEETRYGLKGRNALLQVGVCGSRTCSRLTWPESDFQCTVLLMSSPFELIKIAESMIRQQPSR